MRICVNKNYIDLLRLSNTVKILKENDDTCEAEVEYYNEFYMIQKILELADNCKVLYPEEFKYKIIEKLEKMANLYNN